MKKTIRFADGLFLLSYLLRMLCKCCRQFIRFFDGRCFVAVVNYNPETECNGFTFFECKIPGGFPIGENVFSQWIGRK